MNRTTRLRRSEKLRCGVKYCFTIVVDQHFHLDAELSAVLEDSMVDVRDPGRTGIEIHFPTEFEVTGLDAINLFQYIATANAAIPASGIVSRVHDQKLISGTPEFVGCRQACNTRAENNDLG